MLKEEKWSLDNRQRAWREMTENFGLNFHFVSLHYSVQFLLHLRERCIPPANISDDTDTVVLQEFSVIIFLALTQSRSQ